LDGVYFLVFYCHDRYLRRSEKEALQEMHGEENTMPRDAFFSVKSRRNFWS